MARRRPPRRREAGWCRCRHAGYGSALAGGITAARGRFVLMGDADDSYDFTRAPAIPRAAARRGRAGSGMPAAGGRWHGAPGAMPLLHRWWGNPDVLLARAPLVPRADPRHLLRHAGISRRASRDLDLRCTGMEFATEMIIKATLTGARISRGADHALARRPGRRSDRTSAPSVTAGGRCDSSWAAARAGSSSYPACCSCCSVSLPPRWRSRACSLVACTSMRTRCWWAVS